jgi:DNA (cytosine-5)-methyltransferase 1
MITIGSLFSGIGGFELGLERAIPNSKTIWQVEQNKYCQAILKKHYENVHPVNIICGGFPCQGVSCAGQGKGIEGDKRSGLWGEMYRLIDELRPRIAVMENVPALLWKGRGMHVVMSNLAQIGYDAEWTIISARQFGAPHLRKRVFIIAYPRSISDRGKHNTKILHDKERNTANNTKKIRSNGNSGIRNIHQDNDTRAETVYSDSERTQISIEGKHPSVEMFGSQSEERRVNTYWSKGTIESPICRMDDGVSGRVDRIKALGNAIVPQCSEYIGKCIWKSGLLD